MPNPSAQSQSPTNSSPPNGELDQTPNDQTGYTHREYKLEDFSQQRINRGQQEINYLITVVDRKVAEALKQLKLVCSSLASSNQIAIDWEPLNNAIDAVSAATEKIAGEFPPGCGDEPRREE
ncbi:MAG TPA: hypothetical protein VJM50_10365 [Pyrinomonadaceae bacterium]|nr:hypothetical protein [Pyrinomonadaceae bacterium]